VIAEDFSYEPRVFEAPQGVRVIIELTNNGPSSHTLQVFEDETFSTEIPGADTDLVGPGSSAEIGVEFNEAKTYYFRCRIHPTTMRGEIEVQ
jgi:plastocyanin